jgi:hypothetical protein
MNDDDKIEIIPPEKGLAKREGSVAARVDVTPATTPLRDAGGVVRSVITGWQAEQRARAYDKFARETRAKADYIDSRGELAESYINANRAADKLNELPEIIHHDRAMRQAQRREELAKAQRAAEYADIGKVATEQMREHTIDLVKARKEQKIVEAIGTVRPDEEEKEATVGQDPVLAALEQEIRELQADSEDHTELLAQRTARMEWLAKQGK